MSVVVPYSEEPTSRALRVLRERYRKNPKVRQGLSATARFLTARLLDSTGVMKSVGPLLTGDVIFTNLSGQAIGLSRSSAKTSRTPLEAAVWYYAAAKIAESRLLAPDVSTEYAAFGVPGTRAGTRYTPEEAKELLGARNHSDLDYAIQLQRLDRYNSFAPADTLHAWSKAVDEVAGLHEEIPESGVHLMVDEFFLQEETFEEPRGIYEFQEAGTVATKLNIALMANGKRTTFSDFKRKSTLAEAIANASRSVGPVKAPNFHYVKPEAWELEQQMAAADRRRQLDLDEHETSTLEDPIGDLEILELIVHDYDDDHDIDLEQYYVRFPERRPAPRKTSSKAPKGLIAELANAWQNASETEKTASRQRQERRKNTRSKTRAAAKQITA